MTIILFVRMLPLLLLVRFVGATAAAKNENPRALKPATPTTTSTEKTTPTPLFQPFCTHQCAIHPKFHYSFEQGALETTQGLTSELLQHCIDLCITERQHCCSTNRLIIPEGGSGTSRSSSSNNNLLSCSDGCEMAYYIGSQTRTKQQDDTTTTMTHDATQEVKQNQGQQQPPHFLRRRSTRQSQSRTDQEDEEHEIVDITTLIRTCKSYCDEGNHNLNNRTKRCRYTPPYAATYQPRLPEFDLCGSLRCEAAPAATPASSSVCSNATQVASTIDECYDGCDLAATLFRTNDETGTPTRVFYQGFRASRTSNADEDADANDESGEDFTTTCRPHPASTSTPSSSIERYPRFLFAGQSNIIGHSNQAQPTLFHDMLQLVTMHIPSEETDSVEDAGRGRRTTRRRTTRAETRSRRRSTTTTTTLIADLTAVIDQGLDSIPESAQHEAELIAALATATTTTRTEPKNRGLAARQQPQGGGMFHPERILQPHSSVVCSLTVPDEHTEQQQPPPQSLDCERPVTPTACGSNHEGFGPELMFAHAFLSSSSSSSTNTEDEHRYTNPYNSRHQKEKNTNDSTTTQLGIVKVGKGGSRIQQWLNTATETQQEQRWRTQELHEMHGGHSDSDDNGDGDTSRDTETVEEDNYWSLLRESIHAAAGTIEAFVWFQGESEQLLFGNQKTSEEEELDPESAATKDPNPDDADPDVESIYYHRLSKLVADVRQEIYTAYVINKTKTKNKTINAEVDDDENDDDDTRVLIFESPEDVPVVIVELGSWAASIGTKAAIKIAGAAASLNDEATNYDQFFPGPIIAAQRKYVAEHPTNSMLVHTGGHKNPSHQLSQYYHYDAASILIIGDRIAKALSTLTSIQYEKQQQQKQQEQYPPKASSLSTITTGQQQATTFTKPTTQSNDKERDSTPMGI